MGKDKKQGSEKKVDKKKTKSSSKSKQVGKKSSSKIGIPRDGSKVVSKTGKKGTAGENEGGDNGQKVDVNRQAINQLIEMVEAVDPNNIDSKTKSNLKKIYELVQEVQGRSVKIKMKKGDKGATSAPIVAASKVSVAPPNEDKGGPADGGPKSPPKDEPKEVHSKMAKVTSSMAPNEAPNGEPAKEPAKDEPTSTVK